MLAVMRLIVFVALGMASVHAARPNIVLIVADDLGYQELNVVALRKTAELGLES
ncbi:MAG: hypothetical protein ACI9DF_005977 [Verrucomicrobiales bacterium]|jgi:hypothetical protein